MAWLKKKLHRTRAELRKKLRLLIKLKRELQNHSFTELKTDRSTIQNSNRVLGVERKLAIQKFLLWFVLFVLIGVITIGYAWKNRVNLLPKINKTTQEKPYLLISEKTKGVKR